MSVTPLITAVVPSLNQGHFLQAALASLFAQTVPIEVFVMDGGSTDETGDILTAWSARLAGFRSHPDRGQAAAINEGIVRGTAPYVMWLNSDDYLLPDALLPLVAALEADPDLPAAYGRAYHLSEKTGQRRAVWVEPFNEARLALRCIICQPATLIRRSAWEALGGLDESLHLAMDYDLWWRLYRMGGKLQYVDVDVAVNREHDGTKTRNFRRSHYQEAIAIVRKNYGRVPWKWYLAQPYAVWFKSLKWF